MRHSLLPALLLSLVSSAWAPAQVPAGGEFTVSVPNGGGSDPRVAVDPAGNFMVVWVWGDGGGGPFPDQGVFARRFDRSGAALGPMFRVNTATPDDQEDAQVVADALGRFVVAWTSAGTPAGVFGRRYDGDGTALGDEFKIDTTFGSLLIEDVACGSAGNCAFAGFTGTDYSYDVVGRFFDATLAPRTDIFRVNTYTSGDHKHASVASDAAGNVVVAWSDLWRYDGNGAGIFAQRYDASGAPRGAEFRVNSYTPGSQGSPAVASDPAGNFVVVWERTPPSSIFSDVAGQRFDSTGAPRGAEFKVNTTQGRFRAFPDVAFDAAGNFAVVWSSSGLTGDIHAQRYDASGTPRGAEFMVNTYTPSQQYQPRVASDAAGNLTIVWSSEVSTGSGWAVMGRRYGGILPEAMALDTSPSPASDGNRVLEPGESVAVRPSWLNVNGAPQTFNGAGMSFTGPAASGVAYTLQDAVAQYGTAANGATVTCADCYWVRVGIAGARPGTHWDATLTERLTPDALGMTMPWPIHVGQSFPDVPRTSPYYRHVETMLHRGVTAGCGAGNYCPDGPTTREQMAAFVLLAKVGPGYAPVACSPPNLFADVPETSPFCGVIEELARRGVVAGCGDGNYCPATEVSREQMAVFVLRTLDPALDPPACTTPLFTDVPASNPFCRWIEELARRGVVGGCADGLFCPAAPVTREQMAVFVSGTFGLTLYGP